MHTRASPWAQHFFKHTRVEIPALVNRRAMGHLQSESRVSGESVNAARSFILCYPSGVAIHSWQASLCAYLEGKWRSSCGARLEKGAQAALARCDEGVMAV